MATTSHPHRSVTDAPRHVRAMPRDTTRTPCVHGGPRFGWGHTRPHELWAGEHTLCPWEPWVRVYPLCAWGPTVRGYASSARPVKNDPTVSDRIAARKA